MRYHQGIPAEWTQEKGYKRGVLFPYGDGLPDDVQTQLTEVDPNQIVAAHYHLKQYEFIFMLEGELEYFFSDFVLKGDLLYSFNEKSVFVKAGGLLVIEPMELHSTVNHSSSECKFLTVKTHGNKDDTVWPDPKSIRSGRPI